MADPNTQPPNPYQRRPPPGPTSGPQLQPGQAPMVPPQQAQGFMGDVGQGMQQGSPAYKFWMWLQQLQNNPDPNAQRDMAQLEQLMDPNRDRSQPLPVDPTAKNGMDIPGRMGGGPASGAAPLPAPSPGGTNMQNGLLADQEADNPSGGGPGLNQNPGYPTPMDGNLPAGSGQPGAQPLPPKSPGAPGGPGAGGPGGPPPTAPGMPGAGGAGPGGNPGGPNAGAVGMGPGGGGPDMSQDALRNVNVYGLRDDDSIGGWAGRVFEQGMADNGRSLRMQDSPQNAASPWYSWLKSTLGVDAPVAAMMHSFTQGTDLTGAAQGMMGDLAGGKGLHAGGMGGDLRSIMDAFEQYNKGEFHGSDNQMAFMDKLGKDRGLAQALMMAGGSTGTAMSGWGRGATSDRIKDLSDAYFMDPAAHVDQATGQDTPFFSYLSKGMQR